MRHASLAHRGARRPGRRCDRRGLGDVAAAALGRRRPTTRSRAVEAQAPTCARADAQARAGRRNPLSIDRSYVRAVGRAGRPGTSAARARAEPEAVQLQPANAEPWLRLAQFELDQSNPPPPCARSAPRCTSTRARRSCSRPTSTPAAPRPSGAPTPPRRVAKRPRRSASPRGRRRGTPPRSGAAAHRRAGRPRRTRRR